MEVTKFFEMCHFSTKLIVEIYRIQPKQVCQPKKKAIFMLTLNAPSRIPKTVLNKQSGRLLLR